MWRELGMIHVLVVSGGHLSILAAFIRMILTWALLATFSGQSISRERLVVAVHAVTFLTITWLAVANRFEPPVLRAWIDFLIRPRLKRYGYQGTEACLASTWMALPSISSTGDLLSLSLSFFASILLEVVGQNLHRNPWIAAFSLQIALWWALLPMLLPLGLPHPISTMSNLLLAPLIGGILIPLALFNHGLAMLITGGSQIVNTAFAWTWEITHELVGLIAEASPSMAPPLAITGKSQLLSALALSALAMALVLRRTSVGRLADLRSRKLGAILATCALLALGVWLHQDLSNKQNGNPLGFPSETKISSSRKRFKRDKVCIPYRAIERPARNRYCRRKH